MRFRVRARARRKSVSCEGTALDDGGHEGRTTMIPMK